MSSDSSDEPLSNHCKRRKRTTSTSEDDVPIARRKRHRVIMDSDDESDSSVGPSTSRRSRGTIPLQSDDASSDNDSITDWATDASDNENEKSQIKQTDPVVPARVECQSDSSDGNSEKCPICLLSFSNQDIGTPETCEHLFCSDCITEWSKNVNTCPVDRLEFKTILVRRKIGGKVIKRIPVSSRTPSEDYLFQEEPTFCEVCESSGSEETMLLCDTCDLGFHMHCLRPPLNEVPENEWHCPRCLQTEQPVEEESARGTNRSSEATSSRSARTRRTGSSQSLRIIDLEAPSTSQQQIARFAAAISATVGRRTAVRSTSVRVQTRKRRKKRRSARAVVVEYELKDGEKFPVKKKRAKVIKRRKKKKVKRRAPRTAARRNMVRSWVRGRLAQQINGTLLGADLAEARSSALTQPRFSIFGARDQLDYFPDSDEEEIGTASGNGSSAVAVAPRSIATAILDSHRQIRRKRVSIPSPAYASSAPDILSGILESQTLLHSKNASVSVRRDGTLKIKVPTVIEGDKPKSKPESADRPNEMPRNLTDKPEISDSDKKIDVRNPDGDATAKKAPAYPGSGRGGGGGWRGGGGQREYHGGGGGGGGNNYGRGGGRNYGNDSYNSDSYGGGNSNYRDGGNFNSGGAPFQGERPFSADNPWQNEGDFQNGRQQREREREREQYSPFPGRALMPQRSGLDSGRSQPPPVRFGTPQGPLRPPPSWINRSLPDTTPFFRRSVSDFPPSSGGYQTGPEQQNSDYVASGVLSDASQAEYLTVPAITGGDAPPQPPIIRFMKPPLSEDEQSDTGADDEDKYDPMEPTLGDSGSEDEGPPNAPTAGQPLTIVSPPRREPDLVADYGSGSDSPVPVRVTPEVLDLAVQQVLREHRDLISGKNGPEDPDDAGGDSDGDCPNFSIYSAASMGMAKNVSEMVQDIPPPADTGDEDLVQEDDPGSPQAYLSPVRDEPDKSDSEEENDKSNESKADVIDNEDLEAEDKSEHIGELSEEMDSVEIKRKNVARTPIKIVLAAPSIVQKTTVDLYDKDDVDDEMVLEPSGDVEKDSSSENINGAIECAPEKEEDDDEDDNASAEVDPQIADVDKFTESISDAEDERSYTPCLDENKSTKSKDTTLESEKEAAGIEGLDTEMISDDEGNELFNDPNNPKNESDGGIPGVVTAGTEPQPGEFEEGEIVEKGKLKIKEKVKALLDQPEVEVSDDDKKKKKRKPDGKSKAKGKRATEGLGFKKLSKSGKERNYRERDDKAKPTKLKEKRRSRSAEKENKEKKDKSKDKKKEKRKDIERYDVRNVISDKSRRVKDVFGRDTSRPRSKSQDSRPGSRIGGGSPVGKRSPSGPLRSVSRNKKSLSKSRRSPSPRRTSSIGGRRSLSRVKRSISRGRKSISRDRRSASPRFRRSVSPRTRRSPSVRRRKSITPKRRSPSPRGRSPPNRTRRSISPRIRRSKSPRIRRSLSRGRNKRKRSLSRGRRPSPRPHRGKSPRRRPVRRSRSKLRSLSRNRSRSPKNRKARRPKRNRSNSSKRKISRSPVKPKMKRKQSGSFSPGIVFSRSPSRERPIRQQWQQQQDKSPLYQDWTSGSQSMSPSALMSPGWTPPPVEKSPEPRNLRVILTTKDKTKKKEKKKKTIKRNKAAERVLKRHRPKETGPSKEVFTSGNNILVSVSFNKNQNGEDQPAMPPPEAVPKKKKRKGDPANKAKKDKNKDKTKKKRSDKNKRTKDLENKKPVAIIDLDRSPFKELTPSPKAVIVLSDSENGEKEEELMERQEMLREELMGMGFPHGDDSGSPPRSLVRENAYVSSAGPKTPPEPAVKFTIQSKSNPQLRAVNPLHEEEDEAAEGEEADARGQTEIRPAEVACKGPNTPPEPPDSPPSSPDAYDPFEPTKSGSATPERVSPPPPQIDTEKLPEKRTELDLLQVPGMSMSLEAAQKSNLSADDVIQSRPISPREKVMALLNSTRNSLSPANAPIPAFGDAIFDTSKPSEVDQGPAVIAPSHSPDRLGASVAAVKPNSPKLIYSSVTPTIVTSTPVYPNLVAPRIGAFGSGTPPSVQRNTAPASQRTMLPSPAKSSPLKLQATKLFLAKPSPIKSTPIKPMPAKSLISKLPLPSIKPMPARKGAKNPKAGQNGNEVIDLDMDMDSPYSPGSSDFGDLFEPPSDNGKHPSSAPSLYPPKQGKFESFDSLFNVKSRGNNRTSSAKVTVRQMKKTKGKTQVGVKMDEDSLKILDDLPSSAVEMQVKSKYLKKLNRQERVVDEVKLVLKPHYNKKHVTKEEYKDILRRAVPKICHNRSGEINPAKIQALIEAYVRKFRKKPHQVK